MQWVRHLFLFFLLTSTCSTPYAQVRQALVIGNGNYKHERIGKLSNTVRDAESVAHSLEKLGFKVKFFADVSGEEMREAAMDYAQEASNPNTISFFFFSGHGAQFNERNWLMGVDVGASVWNESALDVQDVFFRIKGTEDSVNIAVLDACRTLPKGIGIDGLTQGLREFRAPPGSLIAFSTSPGAVASGGLETGGLSLYTKHLIRELGGMAVPVDQVFINIRNAVVKESNKEQLPWEHSALTQILHLVPGIPVSQHLDQSSSNKALSETDNKSLEELYRLLEPASLGGLPRLDRGSVDRAHEILGSLSNGLTFSFDELIAMSRGMQKVGVRFAPIPDYARALLGVSSKGGLLVHSVEPGSSLRHVVKEGDVLQSVNGKVISNLDDLLRIAATEVFPGSTVKAVVIRNEVATKIEVITERSSINDLVLEAAYWNIQQKNYRRAQVLATWTGDRGNSDANVLLANLAANGLGNRLSPDFGEMFARAQAAVDAGNLRGKFWLMQAALRGWGRPKSFDQANQLRNEAAAAGAPWAIAGVGIAYLDGQGVPSDYIEARRYLERGAAMAQPDGLIGMGYVYEKGLGVTKDESMAHTWYQRAIETENESAMRIAKRALERIGR